MLMIGWGAFAQDQDTHIIDGRIIYQHVFDGALDNPLVFLENLRGISNVRETDGALEARGFRAVVAKGFEAAKEVLTEYLATSPSPGI